MAGARAIHSASWCGARTTNSEGVVEVPGLRWLRKKKMMMMKIRYLDIRATKTAAVRCEDGRFYRCPLKWLIQTRRSRPPFSEEQYKPRPNSAINHDSEVTQKSSCLGIFCSQLKERNRCLMSCQSQEDGDGLQKRGRIAIEGSNLVLT
jgi:hypothetical protein